MSRLTVVFIVLVIVLVIGVSLSLPFVITTTPVGFQLEALVEYVSRKQVLHDTMFELYTSLEPGEVKNEDMVQEYWSEYGHNHIKYDYCGYVGASGYTRSLTNDDKLYAITDMRWNFNPEEGLEKNARNRFWKLTYANDEETGEIVFVAYIRWDPESNRDKPEVFIKVDPTNPDFSENIIRDNVFGDLISALYSSADIDPYNKPLDAMTSDEVSLLLKTMFTGSVVPVCD